MQLFAFDVQNRLIPAFKAYKGKNYFCPECNGIIRPRAGRHRHPHYFHYKPAIGCRLNGKGMIHLQLQFFLQRLLPPGDCELEMHFGEIGRIADVVWISKRLIFEIQCSPLSAAEIKSRNEEYASQGYQVVWILHDNQYNKYRLSGAEIFLKKHPYYFTNMDKDGRGIVYDQFDVCQAGLRKKKMPPLSVDLSQPRTHEKLPDLNFPKLVVERFATRPLHFGGDLLDRSLRGESEYLSEFRQIELEYLPEPKPSWEKMLEWTAKPYKALFQMFLERACR